MRRWQAVVIMLVAALTLTGPALFTGQTFGAMDNLWASPPLSETLAERRTPGNFLQGDQNIQLAFPAEFWTAVRNGELQLWEPDVAGGVPLFTAVYNRLLVPWFAAFLVLPAPFAPTVALTIGLLIAQLATYGLARRLRFGIAGATTVAVGYVFSGGVLSLLLRVHESLLLPVVLLAIHGAVAEDGRRGRFLVLLTGSVAATWLSGFPGTAFFVLYFSGAWAAWLLLGGTGGPAVARLRRLATTGGLVAIAVVAGTLVAAIQLLPTYEFLRSTTSLARSFIGVGHLSTIDLAALVSGRFFGATQDGSWWHPGTNPVENMATTGLVVLTLLAPLALGLRAPRRAEADRTVERFVLPAALLLLAAIYIGGPALWLVQRLPFMDETGFSRARFLLDLCFALTAGYSLDRALTRDRAAPRPGWATRSQAVALLAAVGVGVLLALQEAAALNHLREVAQDLAVPLAAVAVATVGIVGLRAWPAAVGTLVAVAVAAELQWGLWGFTPAAPPETFYPDLPAFDVLEADTGPGGQYRFLGRDSLVFWPHWSATLDLRDARGLWPVYEPYQRLVEAADPDLAELSVGSSIFEARFTERFDVYSPALDAVSARWLLLRTNAPPLETAEPVTVHAPPGSLPHRIPLPEDTVARGVVLPLTLADPGCHEGWVEVRVGAVRSRRLLREAAGDVSFPLPDIPTAGRSLEVHATDCPANLFGGEVEILPVAAGARLHLTSVEGWQAYLRPTALPRTALARRLSVVDDSSDRVTAIASRGGGEPVVLASDVGLPADLAGGATRLIEDTPDRVVVEVTSHGPGLLVLRDIAAPGWRARIAGRAVDIIPADHAFRGVVVPPGHSTVTFTYAPKTLAVGAWGAVVGIALSAVLGLLRGRGPAR